jgi:hypothetical protein
MSWCAAEICRHRVPTRLIAPRSALDNPHSRAVPAVRSGHRGWLAGSPARCTWQDRWLARRRESGGLGGSWSPDGRHASGVAGQPSRLTARRADDAPLRRHDPARCQGPAAAIRAHSAHPAAEGPAPETPPRFAELAALGRPGSAGSFTRLPHSTRSRSSWRRGRGHHGAAHGWRGPGTRSPLFHHLLRDRFRPERASGDAGCSLAASSRPASS